MNTSLQNQPSGRGGRGIRSPLLGALLMALPVAASAENDFQMTALLAPARSMLEAEAGGRVMIYDGLDEEIVERALDEQFQRIEHMMFTHTRRTEPDGEVIVENDGC